MLLFFWSAVFAVSLLLLIKAADILTESAIKLASNLKIPAFIMGLTVVSLGTSLPELSASIAAVLRGRGELASALAVGSTIAGILLVAGASVISAKMLSVRKKLLDIDASLFVISLVLFYFMARDQWINALEGIILLAGFLVCVFYVISESKDDDLTSDSLLTPDLLSGKEVTKLVEILPGRIEKSLAAKKDSDFSPKVFLQLIFGLAGLAIGAKLTIDSLVNVSDLLNAEGTVLAMTMLAIGAALPEFLVAVSAAARKMGSLALGNVFGSSIINLSLVLGISSMFGRVTLDAVTYAVGLPFLLASAVLLIVSGISRRIHYWEGIMYLLVYFLFIVKVFGLF
jgi:cation:H+ antiporter